MDLMRVGFVGEFTDKKVQLEVMDALTYGVVGLLVVTILFVMCQMMLSDDKDEIEQEENNEQHGQQARISAINDDQYVRVSRN